MFFKWSMIDRKLVSNAWKEMEKTVLESLKADSKAKSC